MTQRGNNRQDVFFTKDDYVVYLRLLAKQCRRHGAEILGYCLMTNHVHLIVVPRTEQSLSRAVGRTHFGFTQYVNHHHARSGHLWQNRFHSCCLDERHFWEAMRYIERNPVRAGMAARAWDYPWSTAAVHCGHCKDSSGLLDLHRWRERSLGRDWSAILQQAQDEETVARLRGATRHGRPLGTDSFLSKLEARIGRRLRANPVGRPRSRPGKRDEA